MPWCRLLARDHAAPESTLALSKADQPCCGRVRPLAWCSRPRDSAASLEGALMEAIILAGGQATRLGDAARGHPKALVPIAGHPLAEYQVAQLVRAGVERVLVSCAAGQATLFKAKLSGLGAEIVPVAEPEPLGRGGGLRFAAEQREESGPLFALNGDELTDVDLQALLEAHEEHAGRAATIVVAPL